MDAHNTILTRQLPKTGYIVSHVAGDDEQYQAGWWKGRLNANNKTRFVEYNFSGAAIILDRATGLMWPKDAYHDLYYGPSPFNWATHLANCEGEIFGGFTDWRMPNINELASLFRFKIPAPYIWPAITETINTHYWSSTTVPTNTAKALTCNFWNNAWIVRQDKIAVFLVIPCRGGY